MRKAAGIPWAAISDREPIFRASLVKIKLDHPFRRLALVRFLPQSRLPPFAIDLSAIRQINPYHATKHDCPCNHRCVPHRIDVAVYCAITFKMLDLWFIRDKNIYIFFFFGTYFSATRKCYDFAQRTTGDVPKCKIKRSNCHRTTLRSCCVKKIGQEISIPIRDFQWWKK